MKRLAALLLGLATVPAGAVTLDEAIAAALAQEPSIVIADATRDAANGRLVQAKSAGRPQVTVQGSVGAGRLDMLGFFGLDSSAVTPATAQVAVEQAVYNGGRVAAATAAAKAGLAAAEAGRSSARGELAATVAAAYGDVLTTSSMRISWRRLVEQTIEIERQARLRFKAGESPSTDIAQAVARRAEAEGGLAGAEGAAEAARAHYRNLVGEEPLQLAPLPAGPAAPATLDEAVALAAAHSPAIAAAEAALKAAEAAHRGARAERLPTVGAFAEAGLVRDQFFPDYSANAATVGVRASWQIYNGGRADGRVTETSAEVRAAEARLRAARQQVEEQTITLFEGLRSARLVATAAARQAEASEQARVAVAHEVRVGLKPQLALLDAEREALVAAARAAQATATRVTTAYRLAAVIGRVG
jgi:outer membrane protein